MASGTPWPMTVMGGPKGITASTRKAGASAMAGASR